MLKWTSARPAVQRRRSFPGRFEHLEQRQLLVAGPVITEFMASNSNTLTDSAGQTVDWVEIHNPTAQAFDLDGWTLTDDPDQPTKWAFPSRALAPDEYLLVFASGKDETTIPNELHSNFKLAASGEYIALVDPSGFVVSEYGDNGSEYPPQRADISYGTFEGVPQYFTQPTPGSANVTGQLAFVSDVQFSVSRGFYESPFDVVLSSATDGAVIRYTTDGSTPSLDHGEPYRAPIPILGTTTVRAVAYRDELLPAPVQTHTYLFTEDVVRQSPTGEPPLGFPPDLATGSRINGQLLDYGMDPTIVDDPLWTPLLQEGLKAIPSMSLVTDSDHLFDPGSGIYVNAGGHGASWERPASLELLFPDERVGFQSNMGVRIRGGFSRSGNNPKHAFRFFFRGEYGNPKLEFPLFEDEGARIFKSLDLRTTQNYSWAFQADRANTFLRDVFSRDTQRDMGQPYTRSRYYHLYINGHYWGVFQTQERSEAQYAATYFGGQAEDYDVLKSAGSSGGYLAEATDGNMDAYRRLHAATMVGFAANADYYRVQGMHPDATPNPEYERLLDVDNLIDYMIVTYYTGDRDGPGSRYTDPRPNNFFGIYNRVQPDGFKWFEHDSEHSLGTGEQNMVSPLVTEHPSFDPTNLTHFNPHWLHEKLMENEHYRLRFLDRAVRHFAPGGALSEAQALARLENRAAQVSSAMVPESARWGDTQAPLRFTHDDWKDATRRIKGWIEGRTETVLQQFRDVDWYPDVEAPEFSHPGGVVSEPLAVALSASQGAIYYSTDGSDPRLVTGDVNPNAARFIPGTSEPLVVTRSMPIKARSLHAGQWSVLSAQLFVVETPLRVTEVHYHPHTPTDEEIALHPDAEADDFEFIELINTGSKDLILNQLALDGTVQFEFADSNLTKLGPGERVVVVGNREAFETRYGDSTPVAGEFEQGNLSDSGGTIVLREPFGIVVQQFDYHAGSRWPDRADGVGSSLEVIDTQGDYGSASNWRSSSEYGGSPGADGAGQDDRLLINEILVRDSQSDLLELVNISSQPLDISGWFLSNDRHDLFQFQFPVGTSVDAGQYLVLSSSTHGLQWPRSEGGEVWLLEAEASIPVRFAAEAQFHASPLDTSLGVWPDSVSGGPLLPMTSPTLGAPNSRPIPADIIISELNHDVGSFDYEESFNAGTADALTPVLGNWSVIDGRYHVVPVGTDDTISVLEEFAPVTKLDISVTVNVPSESEFKRNAAIIFDYHSPTQFKFASMHFGNYRWKLGQRDEDGWHFLEDEITIPLLQAGTDTHVKVEIRDQIVRVLYDGQLTISHGYDTPFSGGLVGLGSKNGQATFENLAVRPFLDSEDLEFVELHNTTQTAIPLEGWRLSGAMELGLPSGTSLQAGESLVIGAFTSASRQLADNFRLLYGMHSDAMLIGSGPERLHDDAASLALMKPVDSKSSSGTIVVDYVRYDHAASWLDGARGKGKSLQRATGDSYGALSTSWIAAAPSPGAVIFPTEGDLDGDGTIGADDFQALAVALRNPTRYETIFGMNSALVGDLDGDGDVDFDDIDDLLALVDSPAQDSDVAAIDPLRADKTASMIESRPNRRRRQTSADKPVTPFDQASWSVLADRAFHAHGRRGQLTENAQNG